MPVIMLHRSSFQVALSPRGQARSIPSGIYRELSISSRTVVAPRKMRRSRNPLARLIVTAGAKSSQSNDQATTKAAPGESAGGKGGQSDKATKSAQVAFGTVKGGQTSQATKTASAAPAGVKGGHKDQATKPAPAAPSAAKGGQTGQPAKSSPAAPTKSAPAAAESSTNAAKKQATAAAKSAKASPSATQPAAAAPTKKKGAKQAVATKGTNAKARATSQGIADKPTVAAPAAAANNAWTPTNLSLRQVALLSRDIASQGLSAARDKARVLPYHTKAAVKAVPVTVASVMSRAPPAVAPFLPGATLLMLLAAFGLALNTARKAFGWGRVNNRGAPAAPKKAGRRTMADVLGAGPPKPPAMTTPSNSKAYGAGYASNNSSSARASPSGMAAWSPNTWAGYLGELHRRIRYASDSASYLANVAATLLGGPRVAVTGEAAAPRAVPAGASAVVVEPRGPAVFDASLVPPGATKAVVLSVRDMSGITVTGAFPRLRQDGVGRRDDAAGAGRGVTGDGGVETAEALGPGHGRAGSSMGLENLCLSVEAELETLRQKLVSLEEMITATRQQQKEPGGGKVTVGGGGSKATTAGGGAKDKQATAPDIKAMEDKIASLTTRSQQLELLLEGSRAEAVRARVQLASSEIKERNALAEVEVLREEMERLKRQSGFGRA
eukprot:jgi/Mesvir1/11713/Mv00097-RA.1